MGIQYWTSRGFCVADVDYRGSTGYGRRYREALKGRWGVVDLDDVVACARWLADAGRVDPGRMAIRGPRGSRAQEGVRGMAEMFIGGRRAAFPMLERLPVVNPADGTVIDTVPLAGSEEVAAAAQAAYDAFPAWWATPADVLATHSLGQTLMWPTFNTLKALAERQSVEDVLSLRMEQVAPPMPRPS